MQAVQAIYDGRAFVPVLPMKIQKNRLAVIAILDDIHVQSPKGDWHQCVGTLDRADCAELTAILQDTEIVDENSW